MTVRDSFKEALREYMTGKYTEDEWIDEVLLPSLLVLLVDPNSDPTSGKVYS